MEPTTPARLVVVANRLPVRYHESGDQRWLPSPGGLVSALTAVLQSHGGLWIGWPGVTHAHEDPGDFEGIALESVEISEAEYDDFYLGFSNATLWPLYHDAIRSPSFHRHWWHAYVAVNRRYAEAAARRSAAGRRRSGCTTTSSSSCRTCCDGPAPGPANRVLPAHPLPADRALHAAALARARSSRACSAPTWSDSRCPTRRPTSRASRAALIGATGHRLAPGPRRPRRSASAPSRSRSTSTRSLGWCARPAVRARAAEIRARARRPRARPARGRPARLHQGHPAAHHGAGRALRRGRPQARAPRHGPDRRAEPRVRPPLRPRAPRCSSRW